MARPVDMVRTKVICLTVSRVGIEACWNSDPYFGKVETVRGETVCLYSQTDSCRDPQDNADWHPLEDSKCELLHLQSVSIFCFIGQGEGLTRYQVRLPPPISAPLLSTMGISANCSSRWRSSGATYVDMSRKKAAIGRASPMSRPAAMYGAGEPSCQTQRKEMTAKAGRMNMMRIILKNCQS